MPFMKPCYDAVTGKPEYSPTNDDKPIRPDREICDCDTSCEFSFSINMTDVECDAPCDENCYDVGLISFTLQWNAISGRWEDDVDGCPATLYCEPTAGNHMLTIGAGGTICWSNPLNLVSKDDMMCSPDGGTTIFTLTAGGNCSGPATITVTASGCVA